jgi:hypothetical protein
MKENHMFSIIPPVDRSLLEKELTEDKFVRKTNKGGNLLYILSAQDAPNLIREIGRLREEAFRHAGGGTGQELDIDDFDICPNPYKQLIVWDPDSRQILGGYRFKICDESTIAPDGKVLLSTSELFNFSDEFRKEYLPHMIELGRSFVQPSYQSTSRFRKGLYALDNLWDGLGAIIVQNPEKRYFFGKVTMYTSYNVNARNHLLYFLHKYFADKENLVTPIEPIKTDMDHTELGEVFKQTDYMDDYKILSKSVRKLGEIIPPLINSYMNLSPTMKVFGTAINPHFGGVEETAIMLTINDIYPEKVERHITTFDPVFWIRKKLKNTHIHIFPRRRRSER